MGAGLGAMQLDPWTMVKWEFLNPETAKKISDFILRWGGGNRPD